MKETMLNHDFKFRFDSSKIAANHLLTSLGETEYGGWHCVYQKLSGPRRFGTARFSKVVVSTISNREQWQTAIFPAYDTTGSDSVIDFGHPIAMWEGRTTIDCPSFAEMVESVYDVTCDCSTPGKEIAYLLAYLND